MNENSAPVTPPADPVGRILFAIARVTAVAGGVLLTMVAMLVVVSVVGRAFFSRPVPGDFELVAIGTGVAVFAMLPYCQMTRGNVLVDFFLNKAPVRVKAVCDFIGNVIFLLAAAFLTWRMVYGGIDMYMANERSMTVNFPRWTTFPISVVLMGFLVIVIAYTVWRSIEETRQGRFLDPQ